jgi:hypothetical protein
MLDLRPGGDRRIDGEQAGGYDSDAGNHQPAHVGLLRLTGES